VYHLGVLAFLLFPALLLLWSGRGSLAGSAWPAAAVAVAFGTAQVRVALANVRAPREWDYACFWLYAHVARMHGNLYDPSAFASVRLPVRIDSIFTRDVIEVGFPYPPPSIALFLPAGTDDVSRGLAWWYAAQLPAFAVALGALQRALFPRDGVRGVVLIAALALMLPALSSNTEQAQTNLDLLALVALAFLWRERTWGACLGALAVWVKPYAVALVLCDLAAGRIRRAALWSLTILLSLAASLAFVGPATFATYLSSNPAQREPSSTFTESVNQSLLATILRTTHATLGAHVSLLHQPLYLALGTALALATVFLCRRHRQHSDLTFSLSLILGLLVYPAALDAYATVIVLPLLVLWSRRDALPFGSAGVATLAGCVVLLQGPLHAGFFANALLWLGCALALPAVGAGARAAPRSLALR
jgi:hypothetical protein